MPEDLLERPPITIGITAYNAAETIERAFRSALGQTWSPLEIVIVNDHSMDATPAILARLVETHPQVRLISFDENRGVAVARNAILHAAKGEFVAFFDDDDESLPQRLEKQYRRIVEYERAWHTDKVICHTSRHQHWPDGTVRIETTMGCAQDSPAPAGSRVADRILMGHPSENVFGSCATCSQMARLALYKQAGGFCEQLRRGEDTDLNVRLAKMGAHFVGIAEPLVIQHMNLTPDKNYEAERCNQLALLSRHRDYLEQSGWYRFCVDWLDMKYDYLAGYHYKGILKAIRLFVAHPLKLVRRFLWALPNAGFNRSMRAFYKNRGNS